MASSDANSRVVDNTVEPSGGWRARKTLELWIFTESAKYIGALILTHVTPSQRRRSRGKRTEEIDDVETKHDDEKEEEEKKPLTKTNVFEWEQVITQKAIPLWSKEDVTEEEDNEICKSISKDYLDPLAYTHFNAEGEIKFKSISFLPKRAPFDMMDNYHMKKSEIKLFVRRVLVADMFDEPLPRYLNVVRGVVDCDDLPLNVSREQLQQNKIMKEISKKLVRKVPELMKKLAKEGDGDEDVEDKDDDKEKSEDNEKVEK